MQQKSYVDPGTNKLVSPTTKHHLFLLHKCATEISPLSWCKCTTFKIGRGRRSILWYKLTRINGKFHRAVNHSYLSSNPLFFERFFAIFLLLKCRTTAFNDVLRRLTTQNDVLRQGFGPIFETRNLVPDWLFCFWRPVFLLHKHAWKSLLQFGWIGAGFIADAQWQKGSCRLGETLLN